MIATHAVILFALLAGVTSAAYVKADCEKTWADYFTAKKPCKCDADWTTSVVATTYCKVASDKALAKGCYSNKVKTTCGDFGRAWCKVTPVDGCYLLDGGVDLGETFSYCDTDQTAPAAATLVAYATKQCSAVEPKCIYPGSKYVPTLNNGMGGWAATYATTRCRDHKAAADAAFCASAATTDPTAAITAECTKHTVGETSLLTLASCDAAQAGDVVGVLAEVSVLCKAYLDAQADAARRQAALASQLREDAAKQAALVAKMKEDARQQELLAATLKAAMVVFSDNPISQSQRNWQQQADQCTADGRRLCTRDELCPVNAGGTRTPAKKFADYDMWVPIKTTDGLGDMVQYGTYEADPGRTCKTHIEVAGARAGWASSTQRVAYRGKNVCCGGGGDMARLVNLQTLDLYNYGKATTLSGGPEEKNPLREVTHFQAGGSQSAIRSTLTSAPFRPPTSYPLIRHHTSGDSGIDQPPDVESPHVQHVESLFGV